VLTRFRWGDADYAAFVARLRALLPRVYEAEAGFFPPP
jgi:hypothetical protein